MDPRPRTGNAGQNQPQPLRRSERFTLLHIMTTYQQTRPRFTVGRRDFLPPGGGSTSPQKFQLTSTILASALSIQSIPRPVLLALSSVSIHPSAPINSVSFPSHVSPYLFSPITLHFSRFMLLRSDNPHKFVYPPIPRPILFLILKNQLCFKDTARATF